MKLRAAHLVVLMASLALGLPLGCEEGSSTPDAAVEDGDGEAEAGDDGAADGWDDVEAADGGDDVEAADGADELDAADGADEAQPLPPVCPPCVPDCTDKQCGSDGCGGECGSCGRSPGGPVCAGNHCYIVDVGECWNRMCGFEPVYGSYCGACPEGWTCDEVGGGVCVSPPGDCTGVPETGLCLDGRAVTCLSGALHYQFCEYGACILDPITQAAGCEEVPCLPRCFGRTCGDDGCGGSCGTCSAGRVCRAELGVCAPEVGCGDLGEAGACEGQVLLTCEAGVIQAETCLPQGKLCVPAEPGTKAGCCMPVGDAPCADLPAHGQCDGDYLVECREGVLDVGNCRWMMYTACIRTGISSYGCGWE